MANHYDSETETITVTCPDCGKEHTVRVKAEVEVNSSLTVYEA